MSDVEEGQALEEEQKEEEVGGYYKQGIQQITRQSACALDFTLLENVHNQTSKPVFWEQVYISHDHVQLLCMVHYLVCKVHQSQGFSSRVQGLHTSVQNVHVSLSNNEHWAKPGNWDSVAGFSFTVEILCT